jgi:hypothetical protein
MITLKAAVRYVVSRASKLLDEWLAEKVLRSKGRRCEWKDLP